jgi:type VI secretion system protein ImpE
MTPQELYKAGELDQAIKALGEEIRSNPVDTKRRTFLFELLSLAGEWDRAEKHLDVLTGQDAKNAPGMLLYRSALYAERIRQEMFRTGSFPKPPEEEAAAVAGEWNDQPFTSLTDADPVFGENLEVFIAGDYVWVPVKYIQSLTIEEPKHLRDLIWARARIEVSPAFRLKELGEVLLPAIAPLSYTSTDSAVRMGRDASWEETTGGERLLGQKMLLVNGREEVPLLEFRSIVWETPTEETETAESTPEPDDATA